MSRLYLRPASPGILIRNRKQGYNKRETPLPRIPILVLTALFVCPAGAPAPTVPRFDIDVGIPPGTPLEWSAHLFRPLTTARHGVIPPKQNRGKRVVRERESVVQERVPQPILVPFGQTGLYDHFRVTTFDIMRHVTLQWPNRGTYDQGLRSTELPDLIWEYPPRYPTEIYWSGALNAHKRAGAAP